MRKSELAALKYAHIQVWPAAVAGTTITGATITQSGGNTTLALTKYNRGEFFDDTGATGSTTYQLPTDAVKGDRFHFAVLTAQTTKIDPGAAGTIQFQASGGSGGTSGTAGQKMTNAGILGASTEVVCVGSTGSAGGCLWLARNTFGTWTLT